MKKIINVAEKPSVAKSIATILSNNNYSINRQNTGFNHEFMFDFQFKYYNYKIANMVITSVAGHIMEYEYNSSILDLSGGWSIDSGLQYYNDNVNPTKQIKQEFTHLSNRLSNLGKSSDALVLWLDCDREGENIAYEVIEIVTKYNLNLDIYRAHFSSLADKDIKYAIDNLKRPNLNLSLAVDVRQKTDIMIGYSFTQLQTSSLRDLMKPIYSRYSNYKTFNKYDNKKNIKKNTVISYGPCQFPTLNFIVNRCEQILNFESKDFFYIELYVNKANKRNETISVKFDWILERLYCLSPVIVYNYDVQHAKEAIITNVTKKESSKYRPYPLNTVALQKLASTKLKLTASNTLAMAETLYRDGFISYPRTETQVFSKNENIYNLINNQTYSNQWGDFANRLLNSKNNSNENAIDKRYLGPKKGKQDDKSHPPIHPIKYLNINDKKYSDSKMYELYELITRYFLACVSCDAKGYTTMVELSIGNQHFKTNGTEVFDLGYLEVYKYEKWNDKLIPEFEINERIDYSNINHFIRKGNTSPPNLLSENELISLMDKNGIGTDATIAEHIETVVKRSYAVRQRGFFRPTLIGYSLVNAYKNIGVEIYKPLLRSNMEKKLKMVCDGEKDSDSLYLEIKVNMKKVYRKVYDDIDKLKYCLNKILLENDDFEDKLNNAIKKDNNDNAYNELINNKRKNSDYSEDNDLSNSNVNCDPTNYNKNNKKNKKPKNNVDNNYNNKNSKNYLDYKNSTNLTNVNYNNTNKYSNVNNNDYNNLLNCNNYYLGKCHKCGSNYNLKEKNGYFLGCSSFPKCRGIVSLGNTTSINQNNIICSNCNTNLCKILLNNEDYDICINCYVNKCGGNKDLNIYNYLDIENDNSKRNYYKNNKSKKYYNNNIDNNNNNSNNNNNNNYQNEFTKANKYTAKDKPPCRECGYKKHTKNSNCPLKTVKKNIGKKNYSSYNRYNCDDFDRLFESE